MNSTMNNITGLSSTPLKRKEHGHYSNTSFREQYQEYILISQKASVLQDEYNQKKESNSIKAQNNKIKLQNIKRMLNQLESCAGLSIDQVSNVVDCVNTGKALDPSMNDINKDVIDNIRKGYTSNWLNMKVLDQKRLEYDEYQLPIESVLDAKLIKSIRQHEAIMDNFKLSRVKVGTNGINSLEKVEDKDTSTGRNWSRIPLFHQLDGYPVIDLHKPIDSHENLKKKSALALEESIRWVTYLKHRSEVELANQILIPKGVTGSIVDDGKRTGINNAQDTEGASDPNSNADLNPREKELTPSQQAILDALGDVDLDVLLHRLKMEYMEYNIRYAYNDSLILIINMSDYVSNSIELLMVFPVLL